MLDSIDKLEQQHWQQIAVRWTTGSVEYQTAALQRKCLHVHTLQSKIAAELDWLHWSKLAVSRKPRQHRGTSSNILRTMRGANAGLRTAVNQLQDSHAVSGDIGHVPYDAQSLQPENVQQPEWQVPWLQYKTLTAVGDHKLDLQQRLQRCNEEVSNGRRRTCWSTQGMSRLASKRNQC